MKDRLRHPMDNAIWHTSASGKINEACDAAHVSLPLTIDDDTGCRGSRQNSKAFGDWLLV